MRIRKTLLTGSAIAVCGLMLYLSCSQKKPVPTPLSLLKGWVVPVEVQNAPNAGTQDYYDFGWQTFIALCWPGDSSYRGMPDTTRLIGARDASGNLIPMVWESWKEQYDIFLDNAMNPGPWNYQSGGPRMLKLLRMFSKNDTAAVHDAFDQATGQPLIDQDSMFVRYEVRVDESEYTYFLNNSYYNADSQITAVAQNRFVGFPNGTDPLSKAMPIWAQYGATEVKASWRVFKPGTSDSIKKRYFHTKALLMSVDGKRTELAEIGLVGLHILRLTPSTGSSWYWASFEQVDNLKLQSQYGGTLPPQPTFNTNPPVIYGDSGYSYKPQPVAFGSLPPAIPVGVSSPPFLQSNARLEATNMLYTKLLSGTPFQYYQMIGTVNPPTPGDTVVITGYGVPAVKVNQPWLANSTMETYSLKTGDSNCVSCHIYGYPQMPSGTQKTSSLQVFTFLLGLADSAR